MDTPQVHTVVLANGANEHFVNGTSVASGTSALAPLGGLMLGSRYSVNFGLRGDISEFLVYDEVLSTADRQALEGYLLSKHPITLLPTPVPFVDVFQSGDGLYHTYRIPAIQTTLAGTVLAFAEGRVNAGANSLNNPSILRYTDPLDGFPQGRLLFAGPNSQTSRGNGTLHVSYDDGATWPISKLIYPGSYAYSVLTVIDPKTIGVLYERDGTAAISLARVDLEWLTDGQDCTWKGLHFTDFGTGCPGSGGFVPTLDLAGCPTPGGDVAITIGDGLGGSSAFLAIGAQQSSVPLGSCTLLTSPILAIVGPLPMSPGGPGQGALQFPVSFGPSATLATLTLQAFVIDPGVPDLFAASAAVTFTPL